MASQVGDLAEVRFRWSGPGGIAENTFGFKCKLADAGGIANLGSVFATALAKNTSGGLLYNMTSDYSSSELLVEDVKPGTVATVSVTYATVSGTSGVDSLPPQCAVLFSLYTGTKGRSYRGRFYRPGIAEDQTGHGVLSAGMVTSMQTIAAQLMAVFGPSGSDTHWQLVVISRFLNKVKRATPVGTEVDAIALDTYVRTQRRRVLGVGS